MKDELAYLDRILCMVPLAFPMTTPANPANLIMLLDTRGWWEDLDFNWPNVQTAAQHNATGDLDLWSDGGGALSFWHNKGGIYTFFDGHSKRLSTYATYQTGSNFMWDNPGAQTDATIQSEILSIRDNFVFNGQEVY